MLSVSATSRSRRLSRACEEGHRMLNGSIAIAFTTMSNRRPEQIEGVAAREDPCSAVWSGRFTCALFSFMLEGKGETPFLLFMVFPSLRERRTRGTSGMRLRRCHRFPPHRMGTSPAVP